MSSNTDDREPKRQKHDGGSKSNGTGNGQRKRKPIIANAFLMNAPTHMSPGLWRVPEDRGRDNMHDLSYWVDLAKLLEDAKFHGIFIADALGLYDVYKGPENIAPAIKSGAQAPYSEPTVLISAMAYATKSITFGVTASVTYEHPFLLARRFSTLDNLTGGRIAWNVVTSHLSSAARNLGLKEEIPHDERYVRAEEYMDVVYKLWEWSWRDDAVVRDVKRSVFSEPDRVRNIQHEGKYFSVYGPNAVNPTPQRTPFIFQAGASSAGKKFATKHAETMFLPGMSPESVRQIADEIRNQAVAQGRNRDSIKLIAGMLVVVDETDEKAQEKYQHFLEVSDPEGMSALFGGWTGTDLDKFSDDEDFHFTGPGPVQSLIRAWSSTIPGSDNVKWTKRRVLQELAFSGAHPRIVGGPKTVADFLEHFIDVADIDGFNFSQVISPGTYEDMIKYLWPELRRRGLLQEEYSVVGGTSRENYLADGKGSRLRKDHPGAAYTWRKPEEE